jgi:hypothetical protein
VAHISRKYFDVRLYATRAKANDRLLWQRAQVKNFGVGDLPDGFAAYTGNILTDDMPADLPVQLSLSNCVDRRERSMDNHTQFTLRIGLVHRYYPHRGRRYE